ncbi:MAG TPA: class I SAM-dependent methyltransferase [Candidatus Acidoferrum sp.]|nr:class I SAM-dependent methyltransferase [Candidatus Acidoferrum sp.]
MTTEAKVEGHYTRGKLEDAILAAARAAGKNTEELTAADLAPVDEFHIGGLEATQMLARGMNLRPGMQLLDVGCGIGGPARYFAGVEGCHVTGIDLTDEFVQTAAALTRRVILQDKTTFCKVSAVEMPFAEGQFDRAYMIHVGMNLPEKKSVFREVERVLKTGGTFTIFDLMRGKDGDLSFPVPWAASEETSFVESAASYRTTLQSAGFEIAMEKSHLAYAIEFTQKTAARARESGPPALGLHILMGERTPLMLKNVLEGMIDGRLDVVEIIAKKK